MLISSYNPTVLGDVLLVVVGADTPQQSIEQKGSIVQIKGDQNQVIGYNFFGLAAELQLNTDVKGQVQLTAQQVAVLNEHLQKVGFEAQLEVDTGPNFVVGEVQEMKAHPNSDHLQVCQVLIDGGQTVQIVCGAPNIASGQKVVVAKAGAMMPNGQLIFPGELRKVASTGMICAARELQLPNAPQKRGILVLDSDYQAGQALDLTDLAQKIKF
ncbi:DUF4479 and tRNA-binding domain-containing protein [Lactobacillus sp. DCY120]|uniref:DUF4479 and tRNA-binding domain-containing protein n=1 Tax=Bombilactobacillus apium TaxID=2675299 RepID=A0A850RC56_9LACO|nr:DUF4479 domain-containing protein [Bombilactobacillus apium]NVY96886.1 DUF4479 and tRNA-binding domain-containing protein [Bombilactobacillus apium]